MNERAVKCPECKSRNLTTNETRGELICEDCGLVIEENIIDEGPEWRNYANQPKDNARAGLPDNLLQHDKGRGTTFEWKEAKLGRTRSQFYRMKKWQQQARVRSSVDRNLMTTLQSLKKICFSLGLGDAMTTSAAEIYRKAVEKRLIQGRSNDSMLAASIYAATKLNGTPRTLPEISQHSRVGQKEIGRCFRFIKRELKLKIRTAMPGDYIEKMCSDLELPSETKSKAIDIIGELDRIEFTNGRSPIAVAAGALYVASILTNNKRIQREIAEVSNITEVTIRNCYRLIVDVLGIEFK